MLIPNWTKAILQVSFLGLILAGCTILGVTRTGQIEITQPLDTPTSTALFSPLFVPQSDTIIDTANASSLAPSNSEAFPGASGFTWLPDGLGAAVTDDQGILLLPPPGSETSAQSVTPEETQLVLSPTPSLLISTKESSLVAWVSNGSTVNILDALAATGVPNATESESPVTSLALTSTGDQLAYSTFDNQVIVRKPGDDTYIQTWSTPAWLANLSYSPDGSQIAGSDLENFQVYFLNASSGEVQRTLEWSDSPTSALYGVYLSPNWSQAAWVAQSTVQLMDVRDGGLGPLLVHQEAVNAIAWSPDSRLLAIAAATFLNEQLEPAVMIWDTGNGVLLNTLVQLAAVQSLAFSPDGRQLAVLDSYGNLQTWSVSR